MAKTRIMIKLSNGKYIDMSKAKTIKPEDKVHKVMKEFKEGKLETSYGKIVTDINQAKAIAMSESGLSKNMIHDIAIEYDIMEKARPTKYIKRVPKPSGKGYYYFYTREQVKDFQEKGIVPKEEKGGNFWDKVKSFFGNNAEEKVNKLHEIVSGTGISVTKDSLAEHLAEYLNNKDKWDAKFRGEKKEKGETKPKTESAKSEKKESGAKKEGSKWNNNLMKFFSNQYGMIGALKKEEVKKEETFQLDPEKMKRIKLPKEIKEKGIDSKEYKEWIKKNWSKEYQGSQKGMKGKPLAKEEMESYLDLEKEQNKLKSILENESADTDAYKKAEKRFDLLEKEMNDQVEAAMKSYGITADEFVAQVNKYTENKSESKDNFETMPEGEDKKNAESDKKYGKIADEIMQVAESKGFKEGNSLIKISKTDLDKILSKNKSNIHEVMSRPYDNMLSLTKLNDGNYAFRRKPKLEEFINPDQKPSATEALKDELGKKGESKGIESIYSHNAKKLSHGSINMKNISDEKEKKAFEKMNVSNMITDGNRKFKPLFSYSSEGQDQGVWTDSRMMIIDKKVADEIYNTNKQREFLREKKKNPNKPDDEILKEIAKKGEGNFPNYKQVIPNEDYISKQDAKFTGKFKKGDGKDSVNIAEYSDGENTYYFQPDLVATIKNKFPNAKMHLNTSGSMSPAVFKVGNEIKAVLMPMQRKDDSGLESLEKALSNLRQEIMFKAQPTKYIKKIPNPNGKGYIYFYTQAQVKEYEKTGKIPDDQKKNPEVKESTGKGNIEILKESIKKVASIFADALSAKDAVQPTGQGVEQTGENIAQKSKDKKRLEKQRDIRKNTKKNTPEEKPTK